VGEFSVDFLNFGVLPLEGELEGQILLLEAAVEVVEGLTSVLLGELLLLEVHLKLLDLQQQQLIV
jgi:hypothetical protein